MKSPQPEWIREAIKETVEKDPQLKAGIVHCKLCHHELKVCAVNAMLYGWPTCCRVTMQLGINGESQPVMERHGVEIHSVEIAEPSEAIKNFILDDVTTEPNSSTIEEGKKKVSHFQSMGRKMADGAGYDDWKNRESGGDSRRYLDETKAEDENESGNSKE